MATKGFDPLAGRTFWNIGTKTVTKIQRNEYGGDTRDVRRVKTNLPAASLKDATLVGSLCTNGLHMPALDLDFRAAIRVTPNGKKILLLDHRALPAEINRFAETLYALGILRTVPVIRPAEQRPRENGGGRRRNCWVTPEQRRKKALEVHGIPFPPLELEVPAKLVPSSTPGHYHLYVTKEMNWKAYKTILEMALAAGIISEKYYDMSVKFKMTMLLKPGLTKDDLAAKAGEQKKLNAEKRKVAAKRRKKRKPKPDKIYTGWTGFRS